LINDFVAFQVRLSAYANIIFSVTASLRFIRSILNAPFAFVGERSVVCVLVGGFTGLFAFSSDMDWIDRFRQPAWLSALNQKNKEQ
jgi:hypothetical protein